MKKLATILAAVFGTAVLYGQGSLVFNTRVAGSVDAPVTLLGGVGPGPSYNAQLYLIGPGGLATPIPSSLTTFRAPGSGAASVLSRYVNPVDVTIGHIPSGGTATLRMVAWSRIAGTSYEAARASNIGATGSSMDVTITLGGGLVPPANLTGLAGFPLILPEPSTLALGALGAAALLFRRRGSTINLDSL